MEDKYYSICPKVCLNDGETFCAIRNTPCLGGAYRPDGDECLLLAKWRKEEEDRKTLWEKLKEDDISSPPCPMRGELLSISTDTEKTRYTYLCKANDEECLYDPYDGINKYACPYKSWSTSKKLEEKKEKGSLINIQLKACSAKEMTDLVTALENAGYRIFVETANFDFETGGQYYIKVGGVELL